MKKYILLLLFFSTTIEASSLNNILNKLSFLGTSQYSYLFLDIYEAKLWTEKKPIEKLFEQKIALKLTYQRNIDSNTLISESINKLKELNISKKNIQAWIPTMKKGFKNVQKKDQITAYYTPKEGISFYYNDQLTTKSSDKHFAQSFLKIWLSEKTDHKDLYILAGGIK